MGMGMGMKSGNDTLNCGSSALVRRFIRAGLAAALVIVVVVTESTAGISPASAAGDGGLVSMLVLGDSYSAGNGAGDYYGPADCWRSTYNYARQYERIIQSAPFNQRTFVENRACSGAVTADFWSQQQDRGADVPAQLSWVDHGYDSIFLTIGGNDLHFADIVKYCLVQSFRDGATCEPNLTRAETMISDGTLESRITDVLKGIRARAHPDAKIVLLGYPYLESDTNYRIRSGHFGNTFVAVGSRLRTLSDNGNALQQRIVDTLNSDPTNAGNPFVFVKVSDTFAGHQLAAQNTNPSRWFVQPWTDAGLAWNAWWYHPNRAGHTAEAALLAANPLVPKSDQNHSGSEGSSAHMLDIVFTIDTTGSMGDDIAAVRASTLALLDQVSSSGADWRMGVVTYKDVPISPYGDPTDYPSRIDLGFTNDAEAIRNTINSLQASGGNDWPESVLSGINAAIGFPWRDGAKKAIIVLGDAPPHDPEPSTGLTSTGVIASALAVDPAEIYPVLISPDDGLRAAFGPLASGTGGTVVEAAGATDVARALGDVLDDVATAPVANAGGPYGAAPGEEIFLSAVASYDPDGSIVSYEWDIDNDGVYDVAGSTPTHVTSVQGPYFGLVSVRVTDNSGLQTVGQAPLTVATPADTSEAAPSDLPGVLDAQPSVIADTATTKKDASVTIDVLSNDTDDRPLSESSVSITGHGGGTVTVLANQMVEYSPAPAWVGVDSFTYEVCDLSGGCGSATVTVTVTATNDAPVCADVSATATVGQPAEVALSCTDIEGDAMTYEIRSTGIGQGATLTVDGRLTLSFAAPGNYNVEYGATDRHTASASAIAHFEVSAPAIQTLAVRASTTILLNRNGGGLLALNANIGAVGCERIVLRVNGSVVLSGYARAFGRSKCMLTTPAGLLSYDNRTGATAALVALPRDFTLRSSDVRFSISVGSQTFAQTVQGTRLGLIWRPR